VAEKKPEEAEEVTISRTEINVPQVTGSPKTMLYITYSTKDLPPGLIQIPKDEWTKELEVERIREDLKKRRETAPEKIRL